MKKLLLPLALFALLFSSASPALAGDAGPETPAGDLAEKPGLQAPPPQWLQLFPPTSPPERGDHAMAYDTARGVGVVFGGYTGSDLDDTWEWESATMTWTERQPAHRPSPRYGAGMAYDAARGVTVLFGGFGGADELSDTWLWDGSDWTQVFPASSPAARWQPSMVYDSQRQVIVLFGGLDSQVPLGDTWEWDGKNWVEQPVSGPSPRCCMGMAYDPRRGVTVLFGGAAGEKYNDTWERAGAGQWRGIAPPQAPSPRGRPGAGYFPRLRRVVLFGGEDFTYFNDTFVWDGVKWRTRAFDPRPDGRCCMGMVYDSVLKGVLLFGGSVSFVASSETWLFR